MSDVLASQTHASLERNRETDVATVIDKWTKVVPRKDVVEPTHNSSAPTIAQTRSAESKVSISHRGTVPSGNGVRIAIQSKGRVLLFDAFELVAIEAQGNYMLLRRQTCSHLLRRSISKIRRWGSMVSYVFIDPSLLTVRTSRKSASRSQGNVEFGCDRVRRTTSVGDTPLTFDCWLKPGLTWIRDKVRRTPSNKPNSAGIHFDSGHSIAKASNNWVKS